MKMNNGNCGGNRSGDNFPSDGSMGQIGNPSSNPSSASFNNQQRLALSNPNNNGGTFRGNFRGPTGTNNCGMPMNPTRSNNSMTTNPWVTASSSAAATQTAAPAANNAQQAMMLMMMMNSNGNRNVNSGNNAASFQNNMNNSGNMANANNFISPQQTAGGINRNSSNNIGMMGTMNNMNLNQNAFTNFNSVSRNSSQAIPGLRPMNAANPIAPTVDQNTWTKNTNQNFNASIYQSGNSAAINHSSFSSNSGMNMARNGSNTGHGTNWSNSASTLVDSGNSIQSTYPQQTRQLLINNNDIGHRGSQGEGGNRTEFQRSSSDSFLNVILGGYENGLSGQARAANYTDRSQFQEPLPQNNTDDSKIDLLRLLRADSDDDMNHDGGTTEFKSYGDADDTSKPRRKSEPAISMIQDIFGTGGLDDSQNERHGRASMEGWASPTANLPEPDFDPFAMKNLPQLGNEFSNRQRHNSEPLAMDLLMDDFVDYQNRGGLSEESQLRLRATKGKNKFHGDQKRSRSLDLLSTFTCDPVDDNTNIDEFPHDGAAQNEGSKSRQDVKPNKYNSPFAAFLADELEDHDTNIKTKAMGHGKPRRQKPKSAVKRSRSVDPVEMFSGLGNDFFDDESTDDDGPPTFEGGTQDDIFNGMTPEEQQRLESLGIFSRIKPKRRRSAPLLSHDFLGDLDELDDIVKNPDDENMNESFASFPDALLDSSENESLSASLRNSHVPTATLQEGGPTQSPNDMHLLRMLLGEGSSQGHSNNGTSGDSLGPDNNMFLKNTNKPNCSFPEVTQSTTDNIGQAPFVRDFSPSNVAVKQTPAKPLNLTSMSPGQQLPSTGFFGSNPTGAPSNFRTTQKSNGFNVTSSTHFTRNKVPSEDIDLSNILITIRNVQNQLRNLHPIVIQSGNPTAMEEIAKAFEITAQSSNYLLSSDLGLARRSLNESGVIIMNLCKLLQNQSFAGQKNYAPNFPTNTKTGVLQATHEMKLHTSYASAPLPLPPISKSKRRSSKSPTKTKVVELEDLPPQDKNDPEVIMSRLKALMERTQMSQKQLQIWDKKNGLPKSHSQTMVNSNRSRKQLQKGVILKKWNGEPLIALEGEKNEGSDDMPQKEMDTDQGDESISFEKKPTKSEAEKIVEIEGDDHSRVEGKSNEKDDTTFKRIADKKKTNTGERDGKANV